MKLRDWNLSLSFARQVAEGLTEMGIPCKSADYAMYDGKKGIYLNVLDDNGNIYRQFASGIQECFDYMKESLLVQRQRIIKEYI